MTSTPSNPATNKFPHPAYSRHVLQPAYADAEAYLFAHMLAAHEAHCVALADAGVITALNAKAILVAVADLRAEGVPVYQTGVEDLFFRIEDRIISQIGADLGGNLQLARSRNDLGQALTRMALRVHLLDLYADLLALRKTLAGLAARHLHALMPGYTHTQPAQPVTFAHYLAGILTFLGKDQERVARAYANVNESPLGAAAFTGSSFPLDRHLLASLLGFTHVITSTHHSIGAGDHLTDIGFVVQSLAIGLSRVTKDLLFLATQESGALHIHDSFIQISSIMPQKRNPVVLEHLRARLSRAIGAAQTIAIQCHNIPYGDTQDIEDEILPPLMESVTTTCACIQLYTAVFASLELNTDHLHQRAGSGFTTATELADTLVRQCGLSFRQAHRVVAAMVQAAVRDGVTEEELTLDHLQTAAREVTDTPLTLSEEDFASALNPQTFVDSRSHLGGVAPAATRAVLQEQQTLYSQDQAWLSDQQTALNEANQRRVAAVQRYL